MAPDQVGPLYGGGDGSTPQTAVVIDTDSTDTGIRAEYEYVAKKYGQPDINWTMVRQRLLMHGRKRYDELLIKLSNGDERSIFFDITQFFGQE